MTEGVDAEKRNDTQQFVKRIKVTAR